MDQQRRRIDQVTDPTFTEGLQDVPLDVIRDRRTMLDDLDTELSYYRRVLHGRLDLLDFELRRRRGDETRSLIEALPEILSDGTASHTSNPLDRALSLDTPEFAGLGRRNIDRVLADDFLARLPFLEDSDLVAIRDDLGAAEQEISKQRRVVHDAHEIVTTELTRRYREGVADADELLSAN